MSFSSSAAVTASDVFKIYRHGPADTVALRGASLTIRPGQFVTLEGPSGSGKSTLFSILTGLTSPSAGQVVADGHDLADLDEGARAHWRADRVGVVFQRGNLIPFLSAEENVALVAGRKMGRRRAHLLARELLAMLGLADRSRHRPRRLSGGEVQRAAIAVALANDPALLLGDEVTGELDSETSVSVMGTLMTLQRERGFTMLLATHDPAVAGLANRRLELSSGTVRER
ncbi:MAG: ABC transporter ATP-binding protein [Actinomycetota bacterium]|nr:ABC transporter ATP-binding protein [Actinomycetota bacterium]MDQ6946350.1 ABC transporter ATP-binding protein [Actinomycetota bacterium]